MDMSTLPGDPVRLFSDYVALTGVGQLEPELDSDSALAGKRLGLINGASWIALWGNYFGRLILPGVQLVNAGNDAVQLPTDSLANAEILDEPGVASEVRTSSIGLGTDFTTLTSKSITVPAAGYVLALAGCSIKASHSGGTSDADLGISNSSSSLPASQAVAITIPSAAPDGNYWFPGSYHGIFEVGAAGHYTFYFLGND